MINIIIIKKKMFYNWVQISGIIIVIFVIIGILIISLYS